jgi:hypothetical protein
MARKKEILEMLINHILNNSKFTLTNKRYFKVFIELIEVFNEFLVTSSTNFGEDVLLNHTPINIDNVNIKDLNVVRTTCFEMLQSMDIIQNNINKKCSDLENIKNKIDNYMNFCVLKL